MLQDGTAGIFTLSGSNYIKQYGNDYVLAYGATKRSPATLTLATAVAPAANESVNISFNPYNGYYVGSRSGSVAIKNSAGETLLGYTYNATDKTVTEVTLAGVAQTVTAFGFISGGNGWGNSWPVDGLKVELTVNADKSATVTFTKDGAVAATYTVDASTSTLTAVNFASAELTNGTVDNDDRSGGFDNFLTTITRVAAATE